MKLIRSVFRWIECQFKGHSYKYYSGNFQTRKDIFKCDNCGKQIEE